MEIKDRPFQQKSTWIGLGSIVAAVGSVVSGQVDIAMALPMFVAGLIGCFAAEKDKKAK